MEESEGEKERRTTLFAMESIKASRSVPIALNVASAVDDRINDCNAIKTHPIAPNTDACIFGCCSDDLIAGGKGSNTLRGGAGNDFISASSYINAGQRVKPGETWSAAPAGTTVLGSGPTWGVYETASGEQTWVGVSATPTDVSTGSVIDAGEGNDNALGSWAGDTIYMGAGNDLAQGLAGRDVIYGQDGDDRLYGDGIEDPGHINSVPGDQHGDDLIDGGAGNDSISGQGGSDVLLGGAGNDKLTGDGDVRAQFHGKDVIDGGLGDDTLWGDGASDELLGGEGDDMLWGDNGHGSTLDGAWHGDDTLQGQAGNDGLIGGGGKDRLLGGEGNDELFGDDVSTVVGGYAVDAKYHGADVLYGGAGDDYLRYHRRPLKRGDAIGLGGRWRWCSLKGLTLSGRIRRSGVPIGMKENGNSRRT